MVVILGQVGKWAMLVDQLVSIRDSAPSGCQVAYLITEVLFLAMLQVRLRAPHSIWWTLFLQVQNLRGPSAACRPRVLWQVANKCARKGCTPPPTILVVQ